VECSAAWGLTMAQMGFFDLSDRYASLDAKKDPLVANAGQETGRSPCSAYR